MRTLLAILLILFHARPDCGAQPAGNELPPVRGISLPRFTSKDTAAVMNLARRGTDLQWSRPVEAMFFFIKARDLGLQTGFYDGVAYSYIHMAHTALGTGDYDQSFLYYDKAMPYCRAAYFDQSLVAVLYSDKATTYLHKGDYPEASTYFFKALKELSDNGLSESSRILVIYANLATIQTSLGQYEQADHYLSQAEALARRKFYTDQLAFIINNRGDIYLKLKQPRRAMLCFTEGLALLQGQHAQTGRNLEVKQSIYCSLASLMLAQHQPQRALSYLDTATSLSNATNPYFSTIFPAYLFGEAWLQLKEYRRSAASLEPALEKAEALGFREQMYEAHSNLASVYQAMGRYQDAIEQQLISAALKDSIMNLDRSRAVTQLEIKYRTAQKDKELTSKQLLISRQHAEIANKNTWIWIVSLGILLITLLLVLLVVLYRGIRQKQGLQAEKLAGMELEKEMAIQEKELLKKERDLKVMEALIKGEETERARLARDLHDGIGGMLAAVQMHFSALQNRKDESVKQRNMRELMAMLQDIATEVRKTSHNLMPDVLQQYGFEAALQMYCDTINAGGNIQFELQMHDPAGLPEGTVTLSIYRIIQELIHNTLDHAEASHATIQISRQEDKLSIMMEDDGIGFNPGDYKEGLGIQNLRTRVQLLKGFISIESSKGNGTTVYIEFHLSKLHNILTHEHSDSYSR
jgi:signal transduction histidine kinase